jgi:hypothetical protein
VKSAVPAASLARRGPKPAITDEALLAAIKRDLDTSPWTGESHRKVWARLRVRDGIRVSRKRLLRVMRKNALLSPHRPRRTPRHQPQARRIVQPRVQRTGCGTSRTASTPQRSLPIFARGTWQWPQRFAVVVRRETNDKRFDEHS